VLCLGVKRPVALGCGGGHRLRFFENGELGKIFGDERDEVTGDWKKLHNEAIYDVCSPNIRVDKSSTKEWGVWHIQGRGVVMRGFSGET